MKKQEKRSEDWCFDCKDGGSLIICDFKNCPKAYHCDCVGKDESFLTSESLWICDWHSCDFCKKASKFRCYTCPKAVCDKCSHAAKFVHVRGEYGLCDQCLELALIIEQNKEVDSNGETVNYKTVETYEGLHKEYHDLMKDSNGLDLKVLQDAKTRLDKIRNAPSDSDAEDTKQYKDDSSEYEVLNDYSVEKNVQKVSKGETSSNKRKRNSYRNRFVSWASVELTEFLNDIGKDTSKKMTEGEVNRIINDYIKEHNLVHPDKKRKVICDGRLKLLLRRKTVNKSSIWGILEPHFAENLVKSEIVMGAIKDFMVASNNPKTEANNSMVDVSNAKTEVKDSVVACNNPETANKDEESSKIEKAPCVRLSKFAAVIPENIKLIYLKRSLLMELFKQPEIVEDKVIGSFGRVKCDVKKRNSFQLMQVTGIKKAVDGEKDDKMILLVSEMPKEICINMLSNGYFTEEDCEELKNQVKAGTFKRPTVVELEKKARTLHKDITKHWIAQELVRLQLRIDNANEKGWREKFFEYMKMRQLLQTQAEQDRLLNNIPAVIPDVVDNIEDENEGSPHPTLSSFPDQKS